MEKKEREKDVLSLAGRRVDEFSYIPVEHQSKGIQCAAGHTDLKSLWLVVTNLWKIIKAIMVNVMS